MKHIYFYNNHYDGLCASSDEPRKEEDYYNSFSTDENISGCNVMLRLFGFDDSDIPEDGFLKLYISVEKAQVGIIPPGNVQYKDLELPKTKVKSKKNKGNP